MNVELVDIGSNLTHESFSRDLAEVISQAAAAGVTRQVVTGADLESSAAAAALAAAHPSVLWSTAGVHPHRAAGFGPAAELEDCLALGLCIGITGWVCDERRGTHLREVVPRIPAERLMVETDAPYLLPRDLEPAPKSRRNEPKYMVHVARAVAAIRQESFETLAASTTRNAVEFFRLGLRDS